MPSNSLQQRILGALRLESAIYEEIEADQTATGQALFVVVASALAAAIGAAGLRPTLVVLTLIAAIVAWLVWALIIVLVGTKLLPETGTRADMGQMLRVLGFASAPGLFAILGIVPLLGWVVRFVVWIWQLMAMIIAVRQALDYTSTARAVLVCLIGWVAYMVVFFFLATIFGGLAFVGRGMGGL
jgi:hypothetical protein